VIFSGFGFSSAIFNLVTTSIVNPQNLEPDIVVHNGAIFDRYFSEEIAMNVPFMLRCLAFLFFCIQIVAVLTIP
jgi:hypothetical protein